MNWKVILPIALAAMLQSCVVSQKISNGKVLKTSNEKIYKDQSATRPSLLEDQEPYTAPATAKAEEFKDDKLKAIIYSSAKDGVLVMVSKEKKPDDGIYYFGSSKSIGEDGLYWKKKEFGMQYLYIKYRTHRFAYQAVSVPLKIRYRQVFETAAPGVTDTARYTISTGFNAGFSFGYKVSRVKHTFTLKSKDNVEQMQRTVSFTPSGFIGLTPVGLTTTNTPGLAEDRTVLGFTYGLGAVVGYDRFNVGAFLGFDVPFGSDGDPWIYKNVPWFGLVVALDFIN